MVYGFSRRIIDGVKLITSETLAAESYIIGRYERNEIKPSIEMAKKIADELGVTVDYLLGGSEKMVLDKKLMKRIEDIEALPKKKKKTYSTISTWLSAIPKSNEPTQPKLMH